MKTIITLLLLPVMLQAQYEKLNTIYTSLTDTVEKYKNNDVEKCTDALIYKLSIMDSLKVYIDRKHYKYEQPKLKSYLPSAAFFFAAGMMQGSRDASLFYHIKDGGFFDGRTSWKRKYKNGDYKQGEAFPLSTSVLAPFTDNVHFAPMMGNYFDTWGAVMLPIDNNKKFGHLFLKVAAITAIRSAGHFVAYDILIPNNNRNEPR